MTPGTSGYIELLESKESLTEVILGDYLVANTFAIILGSPVIVVAVNPLHLRNALSPMDLTLLEITRLFNPAQPENAYSPMDLTLLGIVILVNPWQPLNT